jgi:cytochrome P450
VLAQQILVKHSASIAKPSEAFKPFRSGVLPHTDSMFTSDDGKEHAAVRRAWVASMRTDKLKAGFPDVRRKVEEATVALAAHGQGNPRAEVDIMDFAQRLTIDVIHSVGLGMETSLACQIGWVSCGAAALWAAAWRCVRGACPWPLAWMRVDGCDIVCRSRAASLPAGSPASWWR